MTKDVERLFEVMLDSPIGTAKPDLIYAKWSEFWTQIFSNTGVGKNKNMITSDKVQMMI